MYSRRSATTAILLALACATTVLARGAYNAPIASYNDATVVSLPQHGEAQAAANSNAAGANAAASQLNHYNHNQLNAYGHQIGIPLLVRPYGAITSLYAAALPPRSFVGHIQPAFVKDSYGNIRFQDESAIAVAAI